jgi:hypothetical protein
MPAVSVSVAEKTALIVTSSSNVRSVGARRSVRTRRQVGRRVPLGATCGLLDVVPALAVLIPLLDPARWHWWRGTVRCGRALRCWRTLIVLLRRVALGLTVALRRLAVALRGLAVTLRRAVLLRWLTVLLLLGRRTALAAAVVAI